jgi:hypothetical protein
MSKYLFLSAWNSNILEDNSYQIITKSFETHLNK